MPIDTLPALLLTRHWEDIPLTNGGRGAFQPNNTALNTPTRLHLSYWFKTPRGMFKVIIEQQEAIFFVRQSDLPKITHILNSDGRLAANAWRAEPLGLQNFQHEPVAGLYFQAQRPVYWVRDALKQQGIEAFEADVQPQDRYLMERFITGSAEISMPSSYADKQARAPHHNDQSYTFQTLLNPRLQKGHYTPDLTVISLDIETSMRGQILYCIGVSVHTYQANMAIEEAKNHCDERHVFMLANTANDQTPVVHTQRYTNEAQLLQAFLVWFDEVNPDIIIGWNVVNFDFKFLQRKADALNIPLRLGRDGSVPEWRQSRANEDFGMITLQGRVVLDGIDTLKSATWVFESFALDSVAKTLLNKGKLIHDPDHRGEEITQLFQQDQASLAAYNLEDCLLVWEIFAHTRLLHFALERAKLTGLALDRIGGSVAAFDFQYLPRLHRKGFVAPQLQDNPEGVGSPGGYVMDSVPGLYRNVLVLDFKSLYPSIIRTFNIDPLARNEAEHALCAGQKGQKIRSLNETPIADTKRYVAGFNGAAFDRQAAILPELIGELWQARDAAKKDHNPAMSQAIKILMNACYGVLGTPGCRFFDYRLPSSITLRGHQVLMKTRELIEAQGYEVIYGDTDSVFVWLKPLEEETDAHTLFSVGDQLAANLNTWWQAYLAEHYNLTNYLEIEFETCFSQFLMPTIRGSEAGSKKRYAGLSMPRPSSTDTPENAQLIFKGLEAVRTDWTPLARAFQRELYRRVFYNEPYAGYVRDTVEAIYQGKHDDALVYRKRIRRKLADYKKNIPPHVQAANRADEQRTLAGESPRYAKGGWIRYVLTLQGSQPLEYVNAPLDYELYIERQIRPIVDAIGQFIGTNFDELAGKQMTLFSG